MKKFIAKYPSNIALVKYWGKQGEQLPCNASISMTLSEAFTETILEIEHAIGESSIDYYFEGKKNVHFENKIIHYLKTHFAHLCKNHRLVFHSKNSFPHSTGIASSASAFASIAAVVLKATEEIKNTSFATKGSHFARLGSGSASRSYFGPYALWGELGTVPNSSNKYAIPLHEIHPTFQRMRDAILIVEDAPKKIASSVGHSLMNNHPYAEERFKDANKHCIELLSVLKEGNWGKFVSIIEREALALHAMMMTSSEYYLLVQPETIALIHKIIQHRNTYKLPICFTLDAGPNIHLLYPESSKEEVRLFIEQELNPYVKKIMFDYAGIGGIVKQVKP